MGYVRRFLVASDKIEFDPDKMSAGNIPSGLLEKFGYEPKDIEDLEDKEIVTDGEQDGEWVIESEELGLCSRIRYDEESGIVEACDIEEDKRKKKSPLLGMTKGEKAFVKKCTESFRKLGASQKQVYQYKVEALKRYREEQTETLDDLMRGEIEENLKKMREKQRN